MGKMNKAAILLIGLLVVSTLVGCSGSTTSEADTGSITGKIVNQEAPLSGMTVTATNAAEIGGVSGSYTTTSETDGAFQFTGLPAGNYQVSVSTFYSGNDLFQSRLSSYVTVTAGQAVSTGEIEMEPVGAAQLSGNLSLESWENNGTTLSYDGPVQNAKVSLSAPDLPYRHTYSDQLGDYLIAYIIPGTYTYEVDLSSITQSYTYLPGSWVDVYYSDNGSYSGLESWSGPIDLTSVVSQKAITINPNQQYTRNASWVGY